MLKGLAGSPFAIKDCYDVCPDYAVEPTERLAEFRALRGRARARKADALFLDEAYDNYPLKVPAGNVLTALLAAELSPLTAFYIELK